MIKVSTCTTPGLFDYGTTEMPNNIPGMAINIAFTYMSHTARYILIGLQKGDILVNHPEFHKRERTLMSSRNATRSDFEYVIDCIENGLINAENYISHRLSFDQVGEKFAQLLGSGEVVKAGINF